MAAPEPTPADTPAAVAVHPVAAADAAIGRAASRLAIQYVLRSLHLMARDTDLLTAIVYYGVVAGNVGHLDENPNNATPYSSVEDVAPDRVRRPMSVLAVANSLNLSYETTRRHVAKLVAKGHCRRVKGGVIAPGAIMGGPEEQADILANVANLRRLYRALKRLGVDLD